MSRNQFLVCSPSFWWYVKWVLQLVWGTVPFLPYQDQNVFIQIMLSLNPYFPDDQEGARSLSAERLLQHFQAKRHSLLTYEREE